MTLNGIEGYKTAFTSAMGGEATPDSIVQALATFCPHAPVGRLCVGQV